MHVSGDALNRFVDQNSDERIDGLYHDRECDRADVALLYKVVED
ncbi:hypothetical protein OAN12_00660 [Halioglobus sp.]|nr:hypothetical protein [Halioglobus sp.]